MEKYLKGILIGLSVLVLVFVLSMMSGVDNQSVPSVANTISATGGTTSGTITVNAGDDLATDDKIFRLNSLVESTLSSPNVTYDWKAVQKQGRVIITGDDTSSPIIRVYKDTEFIFSLTASDGKNTATDYVTVRVGMGPFPEELSAEVKPEACPAGFFEVDDYYFQQVDCWASCGGTLPNNALIHSKLGGYYSQDINYFNGGYTNWTYADISDDYKFMQSDLDNELTGCQFTCPIDMPWNGSSCSDQQTLPNPTANLTASDTSIELGQSATLSWTSTNATSCTGYNFNTNGNTSGYTAVSPSQTGTIGYAVNCTNGSQTASASTTISVSDSNPTPLPPTVSLTANPQIIDLGDSITLTWSAANISSCTSYNFDIAGEISGSKVVSPSQTGLIEYSIDCSNSNGDNVSDSAVVTVNSSTPPAGVCSYPEGSYNEFTLSNMTKLSDGHYDIKTVMPTYKILKADGSFASSFAYPIGSWNGVPLFMGYGYDFIETNDGTRYPIIANWVDLSVPLENGHNQRVFAVDMPMSEVEPYILPLLTFNNTDGTFSTANDNVLLGDMQSSGTLLGSRVHWPYVPPGSEYHEIYPYMVRGEDNTFVWWGDSYEPGFYIEDGKIVGILGYVYRSDSYSMNTTTPWLVRRLVSMIDGTTWQERSLTHEGTEKCMPLAPLPDFSGLEAPRVYIKDSVRYNELINS